MKRILPYYLFSLLLLAGACTNPRWIVKDSQTIDPEDYTLISSKEFPAVAQPPTHEDPVLHIQIMSKRNYEYAQKVLMARYVQDYKMRPVFFSLGLMGAATAFYLANSDAINDVNGRLETVTLNAVGGLLAVSSIFNFKPVGEPRPTGEERFLRTSGTQIRTDTTQLNETGRDSAVVNIFYDGRPVAENQRYAISSGQMNIDLGSSLSQMEITDKNPDSVGVSVDYSDSTYAFSFPLTSILRPFAKVESSMTELRNAPGESSQNVLAELIQDSQLQIVEEVDQDWYKVLYGISENYVSRSDVSLVWRTSDFAKKNQVVAVPTVPFGKIDVESNIPILNFSNRNGMGLIIGNEEYQGDYSPRKYTIRDLQLMEAYLDNALGYPASRIEKMENLKNRQPIDSTLALMQYMATDSSEIFVYLSGYGVLEKVQGDYQPALLLTSEGEGNETVNLIDLYKSLASIPAQKTVIINNIDFRRSVDAINDSTDIFIQSLQQPLQNSAITLTNQNEGLTIIFSSELDQSTHTYLGNGQEDKKHHIFPYFFSKALQERRTVISDLYQYLQRNVSYTARKLHDEPEDPIIFGNRSINLAE
ncbi:caspase family protein [Aliifodinibius sp. S!AR15-10]|uniref:caspase family protein n=1 Tax=Aliifodinibius sp. S!AR15-10 TaxID=2950437 RepID=UPI00285E9487|nr:caspase family protein [Aliifodinibius sp. S!AR15-10]MDR8391039.1 caspase family protein [Aliifodinibius sp. S!AR15-10]